MYTRPDTIRAEEFTGEKMDYMQLGWLVVEVLTSPQNLGDDYHGMKWEDQPARIQQDFFVSHLVLHGEYSKQHLSQSIVTSGSTTNPLSYHFQ